MTSRCQGHLSLMKSKAISDLTATTLQPLFLTASLTFNSYTCPQNAGPFFHTGPEQGVAQAGPFLLQTSALVQRRS